jgi:hypothetical protein
LQQELGKKYKDRWEKLKESAKKKRVNKQAEASPLSLNENSSSKSNLPSQLDQSASIAAENAHPSQQSPSSPGTKLPFALQKPQQRPGVGGILDDPSNLNNVVFSTPRHSAPLNTTILHATSTGPNKLNADRINLSDSADSIEEFLSSPLAFLPHSQQNREISVEPIIPPTSSVDNPSLSTRRESAPAIHVLDNSSSNSLNSTSKSMYHDLTSRY